jgi:hypothetical protein
MAAGERTRKGRFCRRGYAHAIKIDAMRLLGEFLKTADKNKGAHGSKVTGTKRVPVKDTAPTLADLGLTKKESASQGRQEREARQAGEVNTEGLGKGRETGQRYQLRCCRA